MFFKKKERGFQEMERKRERLCRMVACIAFYMVFAGLFSARAAEQNKIIQSAKAPPKIVVSIKPLQSLVSAVMQGIEVPALIVQGEGSPHGYQLRPQDAKNLSSADIVFWAGPQMESFLQKPLQNLSPNAEIVALSTAPGIALLPMRAGGTFEPHHDADHGIGQANGHKNADLHFWLDPKNAEAAIDYIDKVLSEKDPARAALYHKNARNYQKRLDSLMHKVNGELVPVRGRPFIVFHDAYQYFERRFAIPAAGSITVNPEQAPGAKRVAEIRAKIKSLASGNAQTNICVFSEPQFEPRLMQTLIEGTKAGTGVLDPLGGNLASGPDQYIALIQNLAGSLKQCLSGK